MTAVSVSNGPTVWSVAENCRLRVPLCDTAAWQAVCSVIIWRFRTPTPVSFRPTPQRQAFLLLKDVYNNAMNSRDIIIKLKADGWVLVHGRGSHHHFKHPVKPGRVTVPPPKRGLPIGTLRSIFRQAGWAWPGQE